MYKKTGWGFALIALILGGCIYFLTTGKFNLGIDLRGGTELVYQLDLSRAQDEAALVAEQVKTVIAERLDIYGLKEISIAIQGTDRMVVQVPGAADSQDVEQIRRQIEEAGNLKFMLAAKPDMQTEDHLKEIQDAERKYDAEYRAWVQRKQDFITQYRSKKEEPPEFTEPPPDQPEFIARPEVESVEVPGQTGRVRIREVRNRWQNMLTVLYNGEQYKVDGNFLSRAVETYDENGRPAVAFGFRPEAATKFANLTGPHVGDNLAIVLDEKVRQVARIQSRIYDSGQLTGSFSRQEVRGIVTLLKGGSLQAKPQLISQSTVGAVLGSDSIQKGSLAVVVGLLAILIFMAVYYFLGGMVANLAMTLNVIIILAFVVVFRQTLTFPGIAGILLTIGMSVDANILIFERMREELARGKSLFHAMSTGYQRAFWVIFDSHVTTILTGVVLFQYGSGPVKGFAVTLIAGLAASFFTAVYVTRIILSWLYNIGFLKTMRMMKVFSPPRIDYVAIQRWFNGGSWLVIALTWAIFVIPRGKANYGIDFTGGSRIAMNLSRPIPVSELRRMVEELPLDEKGLFKDYTIQTLDADATGRATSFSLLTRTDEETGVANAQEKTESPGKDAPPPAADKPAAAATPPPGGAAPTPAAGAPAAPGGEPKAEEKPAAPAEAKPGEAASKDALPPAGSAAAPGGGPASPPAGTPVGEARIAPVVDPDAGRTAEARRLGVLERMLQRNNLLLPPAFSETKWEDAGAAGSQRLVLGVNLASIEPSFNESGLSTAETIKKRVNEYLAKHPNARVKSELKIETVEPSNPPAGGGAEKLQSFRLVTGPYLAPLPGTDETSRTTPTHNEAVTEIKKWFRSEGANQVKLSEPFREVFSVGPKVAKDLQGQAVIAVFISMVGIMFYMALRFELMYGIAGIIALCHDVLITIGIMAMTDTFLGQTFSLKINLSEIAAFLTIIGFSINDTIVVFDRVREMLRMPRRKLDFTEVVNSAVNQTMVRTIWTSLTTFLVTITLLLFGGEPIRGFAFAFAVGVVTGCYSSVFIANPVVVWLHARQVKRREALLAEEAKA